MSVAQREDWEYARDISLPFELSLDDGKRLVCEQILRLLPGRRVVCRARQGDQAVLIKLFMGKGCQREANEDAAGVEALMSAGISTPPLLYRDTVSGKGYPVLVFEFLPDAQQFWQAWRDPNAKENLLDQLISMVAQQHQAGLWQRDFHLRNYLVDQQGQLQAIDGGDYAVGKVSHRTTLHNLGMLFGHLPRELLLDSERWVEAYRQARHWSPEQLKSQTVLRAADRFRRKRASRISRKGYRNCSEFLVREYRQLRVYQRRDLDVNALNLWLDAQLAGVGEQDGTLLKAGNSQTVWREMLADREVVIKRYNLKSWLYRLKRALVRSRASRAWEAALKLRAYHVNTPEPLAMIEERAGPLRRRAWLITDYQQGQGAGQYFSGLEHNEMHQRQLDNILDMVQALALNGVVHGDLKATNFILDQEQEQGWLIDLDSMRFPRLRLVQRRGVSGDLKRFGDNWQRGWVHDASKQRIERITQKLATLP